ncbi:hypothetical protein [Kribbella sp. NPDC023855]|uniref:hypothetical protein n=1 Tax=Kribbella sp. NPDC023855 TaxID=3154698 RepID=UPI0033EE43EB
MNHATVPTLAEFVDDISGIYQAMKGGSRCLVADTLLADLELDSLERVEMLVIVEELYGTLLAGDRELLEVKCVADLYALVTRLASPRAR